MEDKLLEKINLFIKNHEVYKIESNLFLDEKNKFINLTCMDGNNINVSVNDNKIMNEIYMYICDNYKNNLFKRINDLINENSYIEIKCNFNENKKYYKYYEFNVDNENISFLDILFLNDEDSIIYLVDKLFDNNIQITYKNTYNEYGTEIKKDFSSYILSSKHKKVIINSIPSEINSQLHELVRNKKKKEGKVLCQKSIWKK